jgi:hypothetical protein
VQAGPKLQTVQLATMAGEDFSPPDGSIILLLDAGGWKIGMVVGDDVPPDPNLNRGEWMARATDGAGNKLARVKLKQNGKVYVGNATQNVGTQLSNLTSALSSLISDLASFVASLDPTTLVAHAATLAGLLPALLTSVNNVTTALDALLDTTE